MMPRFGQWPLWARLLAAGAVALVVLLVVLASRSGNSEMAAALDAAEETLHRTAGGEYDAQAIDAAIEKCETLARAYKQDKKAQGRLGELLFERSMHKDWEKQYENAVGDAAKAAQCFKRAGRTDSYAAAILFSAKSLRRAKQYYKASVATHQLVAELGNEAGYRAYLFLLQLEKDLRPERRNEQLMRIYREKLNELVGDDWREPREGEDDE